MPLPRAPGSPRRLPCVSPASLPQLTRPPAPLRMMTAANAEWQRPSMGSGGKGKGGGGMPMGRQPPPSAGAQRAPPPNYVCFRCNTPGHYIQFCPTNGDPKFDQVQRPTGPVALLRPTRNLVAVPPPPYLLSHHSSLITHHP